MAVPEDRSDIKVVVFDLGRVLLRICDDWRHACRCAGVPLEPHVPDSDGKLRLRDYVFAHEVGKTTTDEFVSEVAPIMGISPGQVRAMSEAFILGRYEGAAELVDELCATGITTACLTNTSEHHWAMLSQVGHRAYFPLHRLTYRFASHLIRARKPDDAAYAHVERATGVPGSAILFFDDVHENVVGAKKHGWQAIWIDASLNDPLRQVRSELRRHALVG